MSVHDDEFPMERHDAGGCAPPVFTANKVPFGIDKPQLIADLEWLAESVAAEKAVPQRTSTSVEQIEGDFQLVTMSVTYAVNPGDRQ
jgi:hypothetical protein